MDIKYPEESSIQFEVLSLSIWTNYKSALCSDDNEVTKWSGLRGSFLTSSETTCYLRVWLPSVRHFLHQTNEVVRKFHLDNSGHEEETNIDCNLGILNTQTLCRVVVVLTQHRSTISFLSGTIHGVARNSPPPPTFCLIHSTLHPKPLFLQKR